MFKIAGETIGTPPLLDALTAAKLRAVITLEATEKEYRVTIPRVGVDERQLASFVQWLRDESAAHEAARQGCPARTLTEIAATSHLTTEAADRIAADLTAGWWAKNRQRFLPPEKPEA